ncbi:MAG: NAD(P)-dependent oxidoreductase [Rhodospirillaceae bacterium]|jgi:L-threonate 2-dehydrogenase|nr:NAD(P)-dependent oxidoreductase [Rhodospirillaceae bacterium]MBT4589223.1 NAD(P)-dependent oxidoreductase [Rhodospirillaceae bacterium]MBT5940283.1 NAD(P)-dependent oxidoreductase [Rhodospirillaceae bacterium]MBT7268299.1 NAD(P)-dependent oxidoreductase [Rhodospirillaceae bacterium]
MSLIVGVIGLGPMGGNVAGLLLKKQLKVIGFDLDPKCIEALDDLGLEAMGSVAEVSEKADVVILSLPVIGAVNSVADELNQTDKPGQIVIECSTLTVQQKIDVAAKLKESGKNMLDAPISATPPMLAKGMASCHIGGDKAAYEECAAIFDGFTASNFYVGEVGDGSRMKILANYLVHVHNAAAAECFTLGQKAGFDPKLIYSVIKESAGASKMFDIRGKMMSESDYREGGGTMFEVYKKDASIITSYAAEVQAPIDLYVSAWQKFNSAMAQGLGHLDTSAVCKAIETAAGIDRDLVED